MSQTIGFTNIDWPSESEENFIEEEKEEGIIVNRLRRTGSIVRVDGVNQEELDELEDEKMIDLHLMSERTRAYTHTPNSNVNLKLNTMVCFTITAGIFLGLGNYIGWSSNWRKTKAIMNLNNVHLAKLKSLQDELDACLNTQYTSSLKSTPEVNFNSPVNQAETIPTPDEYQLAMMEMTDLLVNSLRKLHDIESKFCSSSKPSSQKMDKLSSKVSKVLDNLEYKWHLNKEKLFRLGHSELQSSPEMTATELEEFENWYISRAESRRIGEHYYPSKESSKRSWMFKRARDREAQRVKGDHRGRTHK